MDSDYSGLLEPLNARARAKARGARQCSRSFLGLAALTLSACVSYTPDPLEPRESLQRLIERGSADVRVDHAGPWQAEWFPFEPEVRVADGLSLAEANALALFYAPAIRLARADAQMASAQILQAGVLANPDLFVGPRISTRDSELIFPASIGWELPLWGTRDARRDVAEAEWTERRLAVVDVELATLVQVRGAFLRLGRARRETELLIAAATASREIVDWVEGLLDAGEADAVVAYLARTERDEAAAALEKARTELLRTHRELCELLGLMPDAPVEFDVDGVSTATPPLPEADREAMLAVPALRAAEAAYAAAESTLRLEVRKQYPNVRLGPEYESDRGDTTVGFGFGITLPLFDRNQGGIASAEEARLRARERYRTTLLAVAHVEAEARADFGAAERLLRIHREGAMRDAEAAARALEIRLRTGSVDVVEVLTAQRTIVRTRVRMLELEERAAAARLRAAVAGGGALQRRANTADEEIEK